MLSALALPRLVVVWCNCRTAEPTTIQIELLKEDIIISASGHKSASKTALRSFVGICKHSGGESEQVMAYNCILDCVDAPSDTFMG